MDYHLGIGILCHRAEVERQRSGALNNPGEVKVVIRGGAEGGDRLSHDPDHGHRCHDDVPAATFDDAEDLSPGWDRGRDPANVPSATFDDADDLSSG